MYGKIEDGVLKLSSESRSTISQGIRMISATMPINGDKKIIFMNSKPTIDIYSKLDCTFLEFEDHIEVSYIVKDQDIEIIKTENKLFWDINYFYIESLDLYAPKYTYLGNEKRSIFDDYPILMIGAMAGRSIPIMLYKTPNFEEKFTKEYIQSLITIITDPDKLESYFDFLSTKLLFTDRKLPTVI